MWPLYTAGWASVRRLGGSCGRLVWRTRIMTSDGHTADKASTQPDTKRLVADRLIFKNLSREFVPDLLKNHGDFLVRRGSEGGWVISVNTRERIQHVKIEQDHKGYFLEGDKFPTIESLVCYYFETGEYLTRRTHARLLNPIHNTFDVIDSSRLKFMKRLGQGNFGEVWKATLYPTGEEVAIKIVSGGAKDQDRRECLEEARLMSVLDHPNVVKLIGLCFYEQSSNKPPRLLIVMEFCNYGCLEKLLEKDMLEDRGKVRALLDSALGLDYLHKHEIVHRDIASRNCLVMKTSSRFVVKIADFGLSRVAPEHYQLKTKRKLPVFSTPPDTLVLREWTTASDVWSFGILIHEVYNRGKNPYEEHFVADKKFNLRDLIDKLNAGFRLPFPAGMPKEIQDVAAACMRKSSERPTMSEVATHIGNFYSGCVLH